MPGVILKKLGSKWRTVLEGTRTLARNPQGTPVDGGGWLPREKAKGMRQVGYINEAVKENQ